MRHIAIASVLALGCSASIAVAGTTTFDNGIEGWGVFFDNDGTLGDFLEPEGGNPGAHLRWTMVDTFGCTFKNDSQREIIGNYARWGSPVKLAVDVKVDTITWDGMEVSRNLIVELVDYNEPGSPYPWTSVWYNLGPISLAQTPDWTHFEIIIADPTSETLPPGWGGYGDETPQGEPTLPPDRTFASVLANVEEIRFTTYEPGWFYGFTNYQLRFDNPTVQPVCILPGDTNNDGLQNGSDIENFVACALGTGGLGCACGDFDGDEKVTAADVASFVQALLDAP